MNLHMNTRNRIHAIDIVRGIAMIIMLLDHVRIFWNSGSGIDPYDLSNTSSLLFYTRWITHICAPIFILLTGTSLYLRKVYKKQSDKEAMIFTLKRGLILILIEFFIISNIWGHVIFVNGIMLNVIWVIGISLILLSFLQFLPSRLAGLLGLAFIIFHNFIPTMNFDSNAANLIWSILHQHEVIHFSPAWEIEVLYPLIPWLGVMALGYALGELYTCRRNVRKNSLLAGSILFIFSFIVLRLTNSYGDPIPFIRQNNGMLGMMSFLSLEKYPPSCLFLLATLGITLFLLYILDGAEVKDGNPFLVFGRTPLFFYVVHLYLLMAVTIVSMIILYKTGVLITYEDQIPMSLGLHITYIVWLLSLIVMYFPCKKYDRLKSTKRYGWLQYL